MASEACARGRRFGRWRACRVGAVCSPCVDTALDAGDALTLEQLLRAATVEPSALLLRAELELAVRWLQDAQNASEVTLETCLELQAMLAESQALLRDQLRREQVLADLVALLARRAAASEDDDPYWRDTLRLRAALAAS